MPRFSPCHRSLTVFVSTSTCGSRHQRPPRPRSPTPTPPCPGHHAPSPARRPPLEPQAQPRRPIHSPLALSPPRRRHPTPPPPPPRPPPPSAPRPQHNLSYSDTDPPSSPT